jgi:hypothetical protein
MTDPAELLAALERVSAGLPDIAFAMEDGDHWTWSRDGKPFAALTGSTVELRIGTAIAVAAVRTPDTAPSEKGYEWIAFTPGTLDGHARDRLEAWFAAAYRRATG